MLLTAWSALPDAARLHGAVGVGPRSAAVLREPPSTGHLQPPPPPCTRRPARASSAGAGIGGRQAGRAAGLPSRRTGAVEVRGRLLVLGAPAEGRAVVALGGPASKEVDWDVTGADGAFDLRLPPGSYEMRLGDGGPRLGRVELRPGAPSRLLDLGWISRDLPGGGPPR